LRKALMVLKNLFIIVCVLFSLPAQASDAWFIAAKLGGASPKQSYQEVNFNAVKFDFDGGVDYALSVGKSFEKFIVELEYSLRDFDSNSRIIIPTGDIEELDGHQVQESLFVNGYIFQPIGSKTSLFLGVGIGKTNVQWKGVTSSAFPEIINSDDVVNTYKLMMGAEMSLTELLSLTLSYQYLLLDDVVLSVPGGDSGKLNNQDIEIFNIGFKYKF